jgi:ribosomal protein L22
MRGTLGQPTDTVSSVVQESVLKTPICFHREQSQIQSKIRNLKLKKEIKFIKFIIKRKKKTPLFQVQTALV